MNETGPKDMPAPASNRSERVTFAPSSQELDRRLQVVRRSMEASGVDVLVCYTNTDGLGGYVKYLTDLSTAGGYPLAVVVPRDTLMTVVMHGEHGVVRHLPDEGDGVLYQVATVRTTWGFASAHYCRTYDAEAITAALTPYAAGTVGLVGTQLPHAVVEHLRCELPRARLIDATDLVDRVKAIKSAEEREEIRAAARLQREVFHATLAAIEPGRREWDIVGEAMRVSHELGSEGGALLIGSAPPGEPASPNPPRHQNRRICADDRIVILIEPAGPGGYFTELGRTVVVGHAPDEMLEEHELTKAAQKYCRNLLVPGTSSRDVFAAYNTFLREHGRPEERRLHCHGQGYDIVERPLIRSDESMEIAPDMNIACHPMYVHNGTSYWLCDGFLIESDGPSEPLHGVEQRIFEIA